MDLDLSGRRIGNIRLEGLLGEGGMGSVYLGFDEVLERKVAVKVLHGEQRLNERNKQRFLREARVLSGLDHPSLCRVYDLIEQAGRDYLVMEYVEGVTLGRLAAAGMSEQSRLEVVEKVARALAVAHRERIVHRDLKPDNIMVTTAGEVKILDFGLARSSTHMTASGSATDEWQPVGDGVTEHGSVVGTIRYMSPEQAAGAAVDEASDVYSLGVLLHELATGHLPYAVQETGIGLMRHIRGGEVRQRWSFDPDLDGLITGMLALEAAARPGIDAVDRRLRWILDKPARAARRRRRLAGAAGVLVLLAATAVASRLLWRQRPALAMGERARVAVLPFANRSGAAELDWVEHGLAELVAETVGSNPQLEVENVAATARVLTGLGLASGSDTPAGRLDQVSSALGCRFTVQCAVGSEPDRFRLACSVRDRLGGTSDVEARGSDLLALAAEMSALLGQRLTPQPPVADLGVRFSGNTHANRTFAMGLHRDATTGPLAAQHYFEVCLDLDTGFERARLALARCWLALDRWQDAARAATATLEAARAADDRELQADCLHVLAAVALHRGDSEEARALWEQALAIARASGMHTIEQKVLNNLGVVAFRRGEDATAEALYREAHRVALDVGAERAAADTLVNLGSLARRRGKLEVAGSRFEHAAAIYRRLGARSDQALTDYNLATLDIARGDLAAAQGRLQEVARLRRELGDRRGEAEALEALGAVAHQRGDIDRTEALIREALEVYREVGATDDAARALQNLALVSRERGRLAATISLLEQALDLAGAPDTLTRSSIVLDLCEAQLEAGQPGRALEMLSGAAGPAVDRVRALLLEARIAAAQGQHRRALGLGQEARTLAGDSWTDEQEEVYEGLGPA